MDLRVYWFRLDEPWSQERLDSWLIPEERERCQRLIFEHHRRRQMVACAALRQLLSMHLRKPAHELRWEKAAHGKPYLADGSCHFNLTHSENVAALAVSAEELGLDVEDRTRRVEYLALGQRFFAAPETAELEHAVDPREFFFEVWTAKEAYIKALGDGLTHPLDQFLTRHQGQWGLFDLQGRPLEWHLSRPACPFPEVSAALASRAPGQAECFLLTPEGELAALPVASGR